MKKIKSLLVLLLLAGLDNSKAQPAKKTLPVQMSNPVARDTRYLPKEDPAARLFVEELGYPKAKPIIVLHGGWGAEHSYLDEVVRPFAGKKHRFIL